MNINRLKVNRLTNPLGFEMNSLSFSWTVEETDAKKQQWARVEVAADESFQRLLWDSGKDAGLSSVDCTVTRHPGLAAPHPVLVAGDGAGGQRRASHQRRRLV